MNLINKLIGHFKQSEHETEGKTPAGLCHLCWGYQEYDKKIRKRYRDKQIDVNNHSDSYTLIKGFVVDQIDGIMLNEGELGTCPTCGTEEDRVSSESHD